MTMARHFTFLDVARAVDRMTGAQRAEAAELVGLLTTANADDPFAAWKARAASAWQHDMQPARDAIAAALHADSEAALQGLRHLLPGLLKEANRDPALAGVVEDGLLQGFFSGFADEVKEQESRGSGQGSGPTPDSRLLTPNAVSFSTDEAITAAMEQWRARTHLPTALGSADLRGLSAEVRLRSIFSARTTNADYLEDVAEAVDDLLAGRINMAMARLRLLQRLAELGYDPLRGFPDDAAVVPPAERGSLQDLSSERRLNLMLETNARIANGYAKVIAGNTDYARRQYPAWELVRLYPRHVPRGTEESHTAGWRERWLAAGNAVEWEGAVQVPSIGRKDSPIWQALGDGEGGDWSDTLGNPFPPFAFNSGMAWRAVPRAEAEALGLVTGSDAGLAAGTAPMQAQLSPGEEEISRAIDRLSPDLRAMLERRALAS